MFTDAIVKFAGNTGRTAPGTSLKKSGVARSSTHALASVSGYQQWPAGASGSCPAVGTSEQGIVVPSTKTGVPDTKPGSLFEGGSASSGSGSSGFSPWTIFNLLFPCPLPVSAAQAADAEAEADAVAFDVVPRALHQ